MTTKNDNLSSLESKITSQTSSVEQMNSQDVLAIEEKQRKLQQLISQLARMVGVQLYEYNSVLHKDNDKNVYFLNKQLNHVNNNPVNNNVKKLNDQIAKLTEEIYGDILHLRNLDHKFQTLTSHEKLYLDKMVKEYSEKYNEIINLDDDDKNALVNQQFIDTQMRLRYQSSMYAIASLGALLIFGSAIYVLRKK